MPQAGRSWVPFLIQPLTLMSSRYISWGVKGASVWADNFTTFMYQLSRNLESSTSWNPIIIGLQRDYFTLLCIIYMCIMSQEHIRIIGRVTVSYRCVVRCSDYQSHLCCTVQLLSVTAVLYGAATVSHSCVVQYSDYHTAVLQHVAAYINRAIIR
jgi:hypothetical protein